LPLLPFLITGFTIILQNVVVGEQMFDGFRAGLYCSVNIGRVYASILGKLPMGDNWRNFVRHKINK
jgi:hypothetical protein